MHAALCSPIPSNHCCIAPAGVSRLVPGGPFESLFVAFLVSSLCSVHLIRDYLSDRSLVLVLQSNLNQYGTCFPPRDLTTRCDLPQSE